MSTTSSARPLIPFLLLALLAANASGQTGRWTDLGSGTPGQLGTPELQATPAQFGRMLNLHADDVPAFLLSVCVFGPARIDAPVFGGVLVPEPVLLITGTPTAATRQTYQLLLPDICLPLPFEMFAQVAVVDPFAPQGWSFSNAIGTTVRDNIPSDFNGDGYSDLAVGVPGEDVQGVSAAGAVNVVYGSATGLATANNEIVRPGKDVNGVIASSPTAGDQFGEVLATGDFNGDGFDDLAIGVPRATWAPWDNYGRVQVIYGSSVGLQGGAAGPEDQLIYQGGGASDAYEDGDRFGSSLSSGDFNGDGYDDLAVGAPLEDFAEVDCGVAHVLLGGPTGIAGDFLFLHPSGTEDYEFFGRSVLLADLDGDGLDELVVGAPGTTVAGQSGAGDASVFRLDFDGNLSSYQLDRNGVIGGVPVEGSPGSSDGFGSALLAADFSRDGAEDLVVGVPYEEILGEFSAGSAHLFRYQVGGGMPYEDSIWHQGVPGVDGTPEPYESFGGRMTTCDHDGDGYPDLVVGVPVDQPFPGVLAGAVTVLRGSAADGLTTSNDEVITYAGLGLGPFVSGWWFGYALSAGRYAGGCNDQLVVGMPRAEVNGITAGSFVVVDDGAAAVEWSQGPLDGALNANDNFGHAFGR